MFPGGNTTIARLMLKSLIPAAIAGPHSVEGVTRNNVEMFALDVPASQARIRLSSTVLSVEHDGEPSKANSLTVAYLKNGRVYRLNARSAVMAGGSWTTKHIVKGLPEAHRAAYAQFYRSPCMMANVALRNWRFLYRLGMSGCRWFEGIGDYTEVRKLAITGTGDPTISPDAPIVLTLKVLYSYPGLSTEAQGPSGPRGNAGTTFADYERRIREQFTAMFASAGFDAQRRYRGHHSESLGTCLPEPASRDFSLARMDNPLRAKPCAMPPSAGSHLPILISPARWTIATPSSKPNAP